MKIGSLEIDLVAVDGQFHRAVDGAIRQVEKFGKLGLHVVARNNKDFQELRHTFGDVGLGIGLAADALDELVNGKGRLGLLDMIRQTRVLGHSFATWIDFGARSAFDSLDDLTTKVGLVWKNFDVLFDAVTGHAERAAAKMVSRLPSIVNPLARRQERAKEAQAELDAILAKDPPPAKVPDVAGAIEKEKRRVERALGFGTTSTRRFATSIVPVGLAGGTPGGMPGGGGDLGEILTGRVGFQNFGRGPVAGVIRADRSTVSQLPGGEDAEEVLRIARHLPVVNRAGRSSRRTEEQFQKDILEEMKKVAKNTGEIVSRGGTVAVW